MKCHSASSLSTSRNVVRVLGAIEEAKNKEKLCLKEKLFFFFFFLSIDKSSTGLPAVVTEHIDCV